jgi:hypothetical protein
MWFKHHITQGDSDMDNDAYAKHNKPEVGAKPGVYKHPDSAEELHAASFTQADAYVRQGWVYDRELPKRDTKAEEPIPAPGTGENFTPKK